MINLLTIGFVCASIPKLSYQVTLSANLEDSLLVERQTSM